MKLIRFLGRGGLDAGQSEKEKGRCSPYQRGRSTLVSYVKAVSTSNLRKELSNTIRIYK